VQNYDLFSKIKHLSILNKMKLHAELCHFVCFMLKNKSLFPLCRSYLFLKVSYLLEFGAGCSESEGGNWFARDFSHLSPYLLFIIIFLVIIY
jgi:hypothetical protein